ncbi:MAG: XRE family transcriptional regulator [Gemmatimonadaceae bacterium]
MAGVGAGVYENRIHTAVEHRVFSVAKFQEGVYVLHAFEKKSQRTSQADAARLLGVSQPRISSLVRGKIDLFSIDALVDMLARAGYHVELRVARVA